MSIVIKKSGFLNKFELTCPNCNCEFDCEDSDFINNTIQCPTCATILDKPNNFIILEIIDKLCSKIDFTELHERLVKLDWKYTPDQKIPTVQKLKQLAVKLIKQSFEEKTSVSTGGFTVNYINENDYIYMDISFNIMSAYIDINKITKKIE